MEENNWEDFEFPNEDFLSESEQNFLEASELNDSSNSQFDSFFASILTGVTTSDNLKKKADLLVEELSKADFAKTEGIHAEIVIYARKMGKANNSVSDLVLNLYKYCEENDMFWHNCSLRVYKKYFEELKGSFTLNYKAENIDFLKNEYTHFFSDDFGGLNSMHSIIAPYDSKLKSVNYISCLKVDVLEYFNVIKQRKLDFIEEEIQKEGYTVLANKTKKGIKISVIKSSKVEEVEDQSLEISNLPSFNLEQRFEVFRRIGFEKTLNTFDTSKKNKNMLLALILGCSVDNAKKLLDGTYKVNLPPERIKARKAEIAGEIDDFLSRNKIKF